MIETDLNTVVDVRAEKGEQCGMDFYRGQCPRCTLIFAISRPTYYNCPNCNQALRFDHQESNGTTGTAEPEKG